MIISCPECSTRFRVDESKIPAQGAKIRCARCKHIFAVSPPPPEPETVAEQERPATETPRQETPPVATDTEQAPEESPSDGDDFGFDDFESSEIGTGANDEFDPSAFDTAEDEAEDDFSFGDDYGNVSLGEDDGNAGEEPPFSFGEPTPAKDTEERESQEEFSFKPAKEQAAPQPDPLADSFTEEDSLGDMSLPPADTGFDADIPDLPPPTAVSKSSSRGPLSVVILFVMVLILAVLVAGGVLVWKNGPEALEQLVSSLTGKPQATAPVGNIRLTNLQGSFITNRKEGELFVIRGLAINDLKEAQAAIQVKGIIFDKNGKQLLQKTIFCGNPISDTDLRKLSYSKMEEMMGNQFGESLANLNVTPGQSIPFTIVFRKLPKTLSEFVVEVADSKPAAK